MQCSSKLKSLFYEIERAVAHRISTGAMKESDNDVDWKREGAVRAMIYNQKVPFPRVP